MVPIPIHLSTLPSLGIHSPIHHKVAYHRPINNRFTKSNQFSFFSSIGNSGASHWNETSSSCKTRSGHGVPSSMYFVLSIDPMHCTPTKATDRKITNRHPSSIQLPNPTPTYSFPTFGICHRPAHSSPPTHLPSTANRVNPRVLVNRSANPPIASNLRGKQTLHTSSIIPSHHITSQRCGQPT